MVPAVAHLREQRRAGVGGSSSSGGAPSAANSQDPLRAALPDMRLGPRALTCNHFLHYGCYLTYSCAGFVLHLFVLPPFPLPIFIAATAICSTAVMHPSADVACPLCWRPKRRQLTATCLSTSSCPAGGLLSRAGHNMPSWCWFARWPCTPDPDPNPGPLGAQDAAAARDAGRRRVQRLGRAHAAGARVPLPRLPPARHWCDFSVVNESVSVKCSCLHRATQAFPALSACMTQGS